jgi:hypothetical protein
VVSLFISMSNGAGFGIISCIDWVAQRWNAKTAYANGGPMGSVIESAAQLRSGPDHAVSGGSVANSIESMGPQSSMLMERVNGGIEDAAQRYRAN